MKKIFILILFTSLFILSNKVSFANSHHTNFEELILTKGKLISAYEASELSSYYKDVDKKKFSGWKTKIINNKVKASFVSETLFSYYNDGYTSIDYSYKLDEQVTAKYSFSANGSISINTSKNGTGFKNGLDGNLKLAYSADKTVSKKESFEIKVKIDPGTQLSLYIYGEGKLTNGVAAKYFFWFRTSRGAFEVFEISTQYQRLEKVRI